MTDLLSRPSTSRSGAARSRDARTAEPEARPLALMAGVASAAAVATSLGLCLVLALVGWYLADAGAHGRTTDALRVGADVWLVGHGSGIEVGGVPLQLTPLTLTLLFAVVVHRWGRWAARRAARPEDAKASLLAVVVLAGTHLVLTVLVCVLATSHGAAPGLGRAMVGSLVLATLAGGLGLLSGTGDLAAWWGRTPGWVRAVAYGAVSGSLLLLAAAAVLVAVMTALALNDAATLMSNLRLQPADYVVYAVATLSVVPNAVLLGAAYLAGPGFAVGTGTVVSTSAVSVGAVPAFPLLAGLPDSGPVPSWVLGLLAVPALAAMVGAALAQRSYRVTSYDSAALRGLGSGLGAGVLVTLAVALAGGAMGTGRMALIGAPVGEVLVTATGSMAMGGLVAGLVTAWLQRRRDRGVEEGRVS